MEMNEYQEAAKATANPTCPELALLDYALGLGEAGEFQNLVKKRFFHGHEISEEELANELGDVLWYLAMAASEIGYTLEKVAQMNLDKLAKRYPEGFSEERSKGRCLIEYDTIDGKWWEYEDSIATRPLTNEQAANVIWGKEQE